MSSEFWSNLNKKKKEELLGSSQTKSSSSTSEKLNTGDFWSALSAEKQEALQSKGTTSNRTLRTFSDDDDDIAPVKTATKTITKEMLDDPEFMKALADDALEFGKIPDVQSFVPVQNTGIGTLFGGNDAWLANGGNKNSIFKSGGFSDGVDGIGDFFVDLGQTVLGTAGDVTLGVARGVLGLAEGAVDLGTYGVAGVADLFGADEFAKDAKYYAKESVTDFLTKGAVDYVDQYSVFGNKTDAVSEGLGQVAGIILTAGAGSAAGLSSGATTALTTGLTGFSGMGSGMNEASSMGASDGNAFAYGLTQGSVEAVSELIFGGLGKGFKALGVSKGLTSIDDVVAKKVSNAAAKYITSEAGQKIVGNTLEWAVKSGAEGVEEVVSGFGSAVAKDLFLLNDEDEKAFWDIVEDENLLEQFVVGSITSAIAQSGYVPGMTNGSLRQANKTGRDFVSGLSKNEQTVIDKVYEQRLAEESENRTLSKQDKNKLYDRVVDEVKRGYVSTDEIESILGGKTYEGYKSLTEKEKSLKARKTAIENEIKELVKTPESQFTVEQREKLNSLREEAKGIKDSLQNLGIKTAKNNLFNEVNKLTAKDTYLRESYNDLIRQTQALEVDDTRYKGTKFEDAAKKTIENARNSGANNSIKVRDFVEFSAKYSSVSGTVIDFKSDADIKGVLVSQLKADIAKIQNSTAEADKVKLSELQETLKKVQEGKIRVNGVKTKNGVAINLESPNYLNTVLGHEVTHFLEKKKFYEPLQKAIFKYAQSKGDYDDRRKALEALYKNIDGTTVDYELTADLVGDYLFTEYDFIKNLSTENRNVFQQIYDQIKYMFKLATAGSKEARELEKVMHQFEKVLRESAETSQNIEHNEATTQFSLRTKPAPKKTQEVYKLMRLKDGEIYPLFIDSTEPLKIGEWYDADSPNLDFLKEMPSGIFLVDANNGTYQSFDDYLKESGERKTKYPSKNAIEKATAEGKRWVYIEDTAKAQKRFGGETRKYWNIGINGSGGVSTFSMRPGYHAGSLPTMRQIGKGSNRDLRDDSFVWTVGEVPADIDYQAEADMNPDKDIPTHIPEDGYYLKATNADKAKSQADRVGWYVAGSYKINRIISDSEARQVIDNWNSEHPDTPVEYDYDRESGMDFDAEQMKLVPKSDTKFSLSNSLTDIDKDDNIGYNGFDFYTDSEDFFLDVAKGDRADFPLSLSKKTTGMEKGEIRTVEIYSADKVYYFEATGYMKGQMLYSANIDDVYEYRAEKKEKFNGNNSSRQTFSSWSSVLPLDGTGTRSDIHSIENGRTESDVYEVYGESRTRNGTGTQERIGENFEDDPEEVKSIIAELRKMYGFTENDTTNDIAPVKEVSSTDDAFFDGEKKQYSLSRDSEGNNLTPKQREFFKDSKVVDDNGNLKVMYHGSPNAGFTVFKSGTYFTEHKWYADVYQNQGASSLGYKKTANNPDTYAVYLDIKKPFDTRNKAERDIFYNEYYRQWGTGTDLMESGLPDWMDGQDLQEFLEEKGYDYDGLILDEGGVGGYGEEVTSRGLSYVVFNPEQVKDIDNKTPTTDPDIRYSLSSEGNNRTLGGSYRFDGKDFRVKTEQDIAPVAENAPTQAAAEDVVDAPILENIPVLPDEELEQGTIAAIRPKPEKQPSMKKVDNTESTEHIAQVLTEEPKVEKKKKGIISTLVQNFVDKGAVFENLSLKTKNRVLQDTYKAMGRSETKAQYFMENGTEGVKSLDSIRAEVEKTGKTKEFYEYLYHKHNVDRMSLESKEQPNLRRLEAKMKELKLDKLQEKQLKAIASEKITSETAQKRADLIKTVREYLKSKDVKNKPVFDYSVTAEMSQNIAKGLESANPDFKEYAQDVYNYMNHLRQMMVDKGVISQETADLWAKTYPFYVPIRRAGHDGSAVNVPLDTNKTSINAPIKGATGGNSDILPLFETMAQRTSQTFKAIDKNRFGVELKNTLGNVVESTKTNIDEVIDSIDAHESLLQEGKNGRNPTFTVFEGGERVTFEITDEMYDALKPTSEGLSYTNKVLNTASNIHRGLLTEYSVPFMVTNAIKDAQDVLINSQHPAQTYANFPVAIKELTAKGNWYTEYMENGGGDNTYFDKQTNTFNKEKSQFRKIIGFPLDKISDVNNFIEKVPRLAEYIASRKKGASIDAAMLDAARVTTDFSAGGDVTKFLNRNGATFLNASVQGFAQQVRNVREAKMNGLKGWLGLATKVTLAGLPAMLLNGLLWDDDEEYEELSDYVKENYYIVGKYGDGKFVRIPKGRASAVIQNAFEQVSNALTGDDEADFGRFFELFLSNLAPNNPLDNNIIAPIKQVMENKTWYGEDLVPTRLQDLPAAEQYDESTDAISKWLGEKINVSPYKINYLLNQYSGGVGDIILPMMTPEAESGDNSLLGNFIAPLKDKFTTDSVMNNQNVSDFYDTVDVLTANAKSSYATDEDILKSKYINSVNTELSDLYKAKREIQNSNLSDSVKYAQVRSIQEQINNLAKNALDSYERVNVQGGYATVGDKHYRLDDGVWTKISDKQLERQQEVTNELGISPSEYWSKTDISYFPNSEGEYEYAYDNPEKYTVSKIVGGYDAYKTYSKELYNIKADKDANGKSISGSRKEKVLNYINNLDADYETKIILWKSEYPSDDTYNMEIINYINNRTDLTYEERVAIFTELGFTVSNGTVYWD